MIQSQIGVLHQTKTKSKKIKQKNQMKVSQNGMKILLFKSKMIQKPIVMIQCELVSIN